mmetsp:Transcript_75850/g.245631  ORF Transcript_75850/g.245631 Transcript_75850/m.245631 type:complete len:227 (+) Transcript_75850:89-769(+)
MLPPSRSHDKHSCGFWRPIGKCIAAWIDLATRTAAMPYRPEPVLNFFRTCSNHGSARPCIRKRRCTGPTELFQRGCQGQWPSRCLAEEPQCAPSICRGVAQLRVRQRTLPIGKARAFVQVLTKMPKDRIAERYPHSTRSTSFLRAPRLQVQRPTIVQGQPVTEVQAQSVLAQCEANDRHLTAAAPCEEVTQPWGQLRRRARLAAAAQAQAEDLTAGVEGQLQQGHA